ncbi:MAG: Spx/MgsR family RNA polymerase-binding regulatory protein [Kofleriaceae bacterium]
MAWTLYHYPGCSTCRRARAWLDARGVTYQAIDLVQTPPSAATLAKVQALAAVPTRKLFNVSGERYREGGWKAKLPTLTDAAAHAALAADGKLIKRPILLGARAAAVGFDEVAWAALVG